MPTDPGAEVTEGISVLPACATLVSSFADSTSAPQRVFLRLAFLAAAAACASEALAFGGDLTSAILAKICCITSKCLYTWTQAVFGQTDRLHGQDPTARHCGSFVGSAITFLLTCSSSASGPCMGSNTGTVRSLQIGSCQRCPSKLPIVDTVLPLGMKSP